MLIDLNHLFTCNMRCVSG